MTSDTSDTAKPAALTRRGIPTDPVLRVLAFGLLVNRVGIGAQYTTFALYFTREGGLSPSEVGLALTVSALAGMFAQVPAGHLADVRGPREMLRAVTIASGIATAGLLVVHDLWALIGVMILVSATLNSSNAVRNGYIARVAVGGRGVQFKAYLRAVANVAMALGGVLGGIALSIGEQWAYLAVFALNAVFAVITGVTCSWLPHLAPAPPREAGQPRLAVLRDTPYVVVSALTGIVAMHFVVMEVGIPLWISEHTDAPTSMVAALLVLNTVAVALFQVRIARGSDDVASSTVAMLRGCAWIAAGFALIALSDGPGATLAVVLLLVGATVHVVGEMISSGGQWGVAMGLAPVERQGQYQGFAGLGYSLAQAVAPTLIAVLCIEWGRPGWFVMGGLILGAALLLKPACAWALATRERYGAATASG
jgi:MFS family permease